MKLKYSIKEDDISIYEFLKKNEYSDKLISAIKYQGGKIIVNGFSKKVEELLYYEDILEVIHPKEVITSHFEAIDKPIDILYEDDYLLIVSKPPHLETIPSKLNNIDTLANRLKHYFQVKKLVTNIHIITRLDKETSGLVMVAKSRYIHHLFSHHVEIDKKYLAIVSGYVGDDVIIEKNIEREKEGSIKRVISDTGVYAKTHVKAVKPGIDKSIVECTLYTGRTHQIRVHLKSIGHPILGDKLYNNDNFSRLALHCHSIQFMHPISNMKITIKDTLPISLSKMIDNKKCESR